MNVIIKGHRYRGLCHRCDALFECCRKELKEDESEMLWGNCAECNISIRFIKRDRHERD